MSNHHQPSDKESIGYDLILGRALVLLEKGGHTLKQSIELAMEKTSELGELTREESEKIAEFLQRDLEEAALYLDENGRELKDWLRFDLEVVEQHIFGLFSQMVDHTQAELQKLHFKANMVGEWHSGEVVSIGTLECKSCGEHLHFHKTARIPPCPKCRNGKFRRISNSDEA